MTVKQTSCQPLHKQDQCQSPTEQKLLA